MSRPGIGVVVCVRNGERYLGDAIRSIKEQSLEICDILVVDGGSTDRSVAIAQGFQGVRVHCQKEPGLSAARNEGIALVRGGIIAFLDSDDMWVPEKLEIQFGLLEEERCDGVLGCMERFLENGCICPSHYRLEHLGEPVEAWTPGALLVRREIFDRVGEFDPGYSICGDSDWFVRLKDSGARILVPKDIVLRKRIHEGNLSSRIIAYRKEMLLMMRRVRARREGEGATEGSSHK